ncbi:MAG: family 43 glycosylhydrolase [Bacilli bacterium]|jgi:hypothetical protein|nr:family 43 glycosylhydrolase [Bacilli bacterium]
MKKQAFNPYLPSYEYIPDGEPHVFGNRVYIYGSHDAFNGALFCVNDYICYSAPKDDLASWRYEGVIYKKTQDPHNKEGNMCLYAPDVAKGPDGRYYLYYSLDRRPTTGVAVASQPEGPYEYLGEVKGEDGHIIGLKNGDVMMFDPAVLVEGNKVSLFSGQAFFKLSGFMKIAFNIYTFFVNKKNKTPHARLKKDGSYLFSLKEDMLTLKGEPIKICGGEDSCSEDFKGHAFFEGSSIRKFQDTYYFIYSSSRSHELCYGTSSKVEGPYHYQNTLVSNADLINSVAVADFLTKPGKLSKEATNFYGNNHGSVEYINGKYYVFYHRHTNKSQFSRQDCAEEISMDEKGLFKPVIITSCGLNGGPLEGKGTYEARIACNLNAKGGAVMCSSYVNKKFYKDYPYFTQDEKDGLEGQQYIANLEEGSWAGYKYFDFKKTSSLSIQARGTGQGKVEVFLDNFETKIGEVAVELSASFTSYSSKMEFLDGVHTLYLRYEGTGHLDLMSFTLA